jgi:malonyl-CoA decarboxylase
MNPHFLNELLGSVISRGRRFLPSAAPSVPQLDTGALEAKCRELLGAHGEASRVALASTILAQWDRLSDTGRTDFLAMLSTRFAPDPGGLEKAILQYRERPDSASLRALQEASEPPRQELFRRLNMAPGGTAVLVRIREYLLATKSQSTDLEVVDADLVHLFSSWFNRGFLVLRPINWSTPASILEKIIRYEAVHEIGSWDELRRRLAPPDRRCFAFFHPQLVDEPLIFVEVALTTEIPNAIEQVLRPDRIPLDPQTATTAVFYSISNCQTGLRGISFGDFLIKQVVEELRNEFKAVTTFATLSPVPGFARWLKSELASGDLLQDEDRSLLGAYIEAPDAPVEREHLSSAIEAAAATYFLRARSKDGGIIDPVARFHLGNGARLERLNVFGDLSRTAQAQALGLMVNYRYIPEDIAANHEAFFHDGEVARSAAVDRSLRRQRAPRPLTIALNKSQI